MSPEVSVTLGRETLSARVRTMFSLKGKGMPCPGFYLRRSFIKAYFVKGTNPASKTAQEVKSPAWTGPVTGD